MEENKIDCGPKVTVNFKINEVMKFFDYEIHEKLKNSDLLHNNGFFVGNSQRCLKEEINYLKKVLR